MNTTDHAKQTARIEDRQGPSRPAQTRIKLSISILFLLLFASSSAGQSSAGDPPQTRWQRSAERKQELTKDVLWLIHEPLSFLMRRGGQVEDMVERYQRTYDPANLKQMAAAAVRYSTIAFYKGFGIEFEKPDMENAKRTTELMHQLGMKAYLYVAGTMFTETMYHELPEAKNWEQRDQNGQWVPYGAQTFRHYACPNEPAYRDYVKRVLKYGVEEAHADGFMFDNVMLQAEPKSCRCPRCIRAFHDFLRKRYPTQAAAMRRFGLPNVDWVQPTEWASPTHPDSLNAIDDPVLQEWVRFRCESLANNTNDLCDYVKSLNPDVVVTLNIKGLYSFNRYWANAVYHPLFANHCDVLTFDTNGYDARIDAVTGALVSQIRSYKMARRLGFGCVDSMRDELRAAVHMAFNYQKVMKGSPGAPYGSGGTNVFTPIMEFFRAYNDRYYTGTDNVADVAVLRNWPSMAYSINAAHVPTNLMEQVLIQYKVPFDLLFEEQLDRIGRYGAVILAGQECVSQSQADALLKYARNGGTLILTDNTGQYNEWRERRRTNPLLPARNEGKGRIVAIPEIVRADAGRSRPRQAGDQDPEPGATLQRGQQRMSPAQWVLPKNHQEIYQTIADGLPKGLSITTSATLTTVMELLNRPQTRETIVHFVNFDRTKKLDPFGVSLRKQYGGKVKSVTCFSPDADDPAPVKFQETGEWVNFTAPATRLYAMIVVAHE
jgi:hypothetical protein